MQGQIIWPFPKNKQLPLAIDYSPQMSIIGMQQFMNPFLGYPKCPLIGRYNHGQYRIAQTICHLQFRCRYNKGKYYSGQQAIDLPQKIVSNLQTIPTQIPHNKPANSPKAPQYHPQKFILLPVVKFTFIITFGEIGKDFLNYLTHMFTLADDLFIDEKLRKTMFNLPIYMHLPHKSGIMQEEVDKGLKIDQFRSQYLSLHLKFGAPAFSPNNMRLGVQGMKKVTSNPPKKGKNNKKATKQQKGQTKLTKYVQKQTKKTLIKQQMKQMKGNVKQQIEQTNKQPIIQQVLQIKQLQKSIERSVILQKKQSTQSLDWSQLQKQIQQQKINLCKSVQPQPLKPSIHKGFIHFYTSLLLQQDYRVYYHWHVENQLRKDFIQNALMMAKDLKDFWKNCGGLLGDGDQCVRELGRLFKWNQ